LRWKDCGRKRKSVLFRCGRRLQRTWSPSVKNEIIEKQDALIGMLYREEDASPEAQKLKREVKSKKAVLRITCLPRF